MMNHKAATDFLVTTNHDMTSKIPDFIMPDFEGPGKHYTFTNQEEAIEYFAEHTSTAKIAVDHAHLITL